MKKLLLGIGLGLLVAGGLFFGGREVVLRAKYPYYKAFAEQVDTDFHTLKKWYGSFSPQQNRLFGLIVEAGNGNWDKVLELVPDDDKTILGSYWYNLAHAMKGELGEYLMQHYQPFDLGLFLPVDEQSDLLTIISSDEVWYQLGDMTMAEHSCMLGMIFSPMQHGKRFYRRLAEINLVNGDSIAADKYLKLLGEPLNGSDWKGKCCLKAKDDFVHSPTDIRPVLKNLLISNHDNDLAREYLLCYDLLTKNIETFVEDYFGEGGIADGGFVKDGLADGSLAKGSFADGSFVDSSFVDSDKYRKSCRLYQEALLIHLASTNRMTPEACSSLDIPIELANEFALFTRIYMEDQGKAARLKDRFSHTYWFFYQFAVKNEKGVRK